MSGWSFLSTHGLVLLSVVDKPETTTREIADNLGVTERSVQRIVSDLDAEGHIKREKVGSHNRYDVNHKKPLRNPIKKDKRVRDLLDGLAE